MAKEEKTTTNESADADSEAGEQKSGKFKFLLIALAGLVLIGGSVAATLFFVGGEDERDVVEEAVEESPRAIYYAVNPEFRSSYVVNGRQRLFQVALTLVTRDSDVVDAFATHMPAIRNKVVINLSGQSFEDLQRVEGKEGLRSSLLAGVQEILQEEIGKPGAESVLFTQFVMQ